MCAVVAVVTVLVHLYAAAYLAHDPNQSTFYSLLSFFSFSMMGVIWSNNLLLTFCFWELLGFSSYRLIGFWSYRPAAIAAATKSFIINRIADAGFLIGLAILFTDASLNIEELSQSSISPIRQTWAMTFIFIGIMGKSAQFPFFSWLPDAMEGPTPVSALIHAATMVAAGVFILVRVYSWITPDTLTVVFIVGVVTALLGGFAGLFQYDIKKILAYSTISQLGFMFMAIGAGSPEGGFLHLIHHAFFKAALFLGAGIFIHQLHHQTNDIRSMGSLMQRFPVIQFFFSVSLAALAAVPFTTGFISKELILRDVVTAYGYDFTTVLFWLVSLLTVVYSFRLAWYLLATKTQSHAEPTPPAMKVPLVLLGAMSIAIITSLTPVHFAGVADGLLTIKTGAPPQIVIASFVIVALGLAIGYALYRQRNGRNYSALLSVDFLLINRLTTLFFIAPTHALAKLTIAVDERVINRTIHLTAYATALAAHALAWLDRVVIDLFFVQGTGWLAKTIGRIFRSVIAGQIQFYLLCALALLLIFIVSLLYF